MIYFQILLGGCWSTLLTDATEMTNGPGSQQLSPHCPWPKLCGWVMGLSMDCWLGWYQVDLDQNCWQNLVRIVIFTRKSKIVGKICWSWVSFSDNLWIVTQENLSHSIDHGFGRWGAALHRLTHLESGHCLRPSRAAELPVRAPGAWLVWLHKWWVSWLG